MRKPSGFAKPRGHTNLCAPASPYSSSNLDISVAMVRSCQAEQSVQDHFDALLRQRVSAQVTGPAWGDLVENTSPVARLSTV